MDTLRVRTYNVRFGDAILISVPDRGSDDAPLVRHILIDVGNVLAGPGGDDESFRRVLENVNEELAGRPLDLYVMTHEHMDHVQGLLWGSQQGIDIDVDTVWMTASAEGDAYYDRFPDAKRNLELAERFYWAIARQLTAAPRADQERLGPLMANNNPRSTADCVNHIRGLTSDSRTHFVHRGYPLDGAHPFREARFEIWAPEEDTSDYYGRFQPLAFGFMDDGGELEEEAGAADGEDPVRARPAPPRGVDLSAFRNLIERRESGLYANALAIDKARNNTSLVFMLEWRGWRLLFPGDAEVRSWRTMERENVFRPVHFLKVSHHGSHNGTPSAEILDSIMPIPDPDQANRIAVVSTCANTYNNVPHGPTLHELERRCEVLSTEDYEHWIDIEFSA